MKDKDKAQKIEYVAQELHSAEDCHINDAPHNHPSVDCGHYVPYGPATGIPSPGNERNPDGTTGPTDYVPYGPGIK